MPNNTNPHQAHAAWETFAAQLDANPGQHHAVKPDRPTARYLARDIRDGRLAAFRPAGTYDALSRNGRVWAWRKPTTENP